jgi:hypothetical protein
MLAWIAEHKQLMEHRETIISMLHQIYDRRAGHTIENVEAIFAKLLLGENFLIGEIYPDGKLVGFATIAFIKYPQLYVMRICDLVGKMTEDWDEKYEILEQFGKSFNVQAIECFARKGFHKTLSAHGFQIDCVHYLKRLTQ